MLLFFGVVFCAIGSFFAGYEYGRKARERAHKHDWSKWERSEATVHGGHTVTVNVRECASCGLTEGKGI
jgi:hypothetical protein